MLYGFMLVGIVLANVIVLADDNWRERQIVPHTIRIFVGCVQLKYQLVIKLQILLVIDLILANKPRCFQNTTVFESDLSDFYKFTVTVMKSYFAKQAR